MLGIGFWYLRVRCHGVRGGRDRLLWWSSEYAYRIFNLQFGAMNRWIFATQVIFGSRRNFYRRISSWLEQKIGETVRLLSVALAGKMDRWQGSVDRSPV